MGLLKVTKLAATQPIPPGRSDTSNCTQVLLLLRPSTTKISRGKAFPMTPNVVPGPERILRREPVIATWAVGRPSATGAGRTGWAAAAAGCAVAAGAVVAVDAVVSVWATVAVTSTVVVTDVVAAGASVAPSSLTGKPRTLKTTSAVTSTQPVAPSGVVTKSALLSFVRPVAVSAVPTGKVRTVSPPGAERKSAPSLPTTAINCDCAPKRGAAVAVGGTDVGVGGTGVGVGGTGVGVGGTAVGVAVGAAFVGVAGVATVVATVVAAAVASSSAGVAVAAAFPSVTGNWSVPKMTIVLVSTQPLLPPSVVTLIQRLSAVRPTAERVAPAVRVSSTEPPGAL